MLLRARASQKCMPNDTWKPLIKKKKKPTLTFWPCTHKHMQHSYTHPWIWGHVLPHMFVMQFSHSHNYVKSKPTDVNAKMLRSPTAKHLYIWEVLMCDINIFPSKATMYTRTSKAIIIICTETHTHRHIYRIFSTGFLHECNHCTGRSRTRGDPSSPLQIYCCFKWENTLCKNSERTFLFSQQFKNCNMHFNKGFFYVTGWWGGHEREGNTYIFSMRAMRVPWVDCYCPAPLLKEPSCHAQEGINKSSTFGTTRNYQLNNLLLSSRVAGVNVNASNKQYWYKVRA